MKKQLLFLATLYLNQIAFTQNQLDSTSYQNSDRNTVDCWKGVSEIDSIVISENVYLFVHSIESSEFEYFNYIKNNYKKNDNNILTNKYYTKCVFLNGKSKIFKNNLDINDETYISYKFMGALVNIDYYLFEISYYEGGNYLLVNKKNGNEILLLSEPYFSIDSKYFACGATDCAYGAGIEIYEVLPDDEVKLIGSEIKNYNWYPRSFKWNYKNELLIQKDRSCFENDCNILKYGKIIFN
jgi:hypothetical protein